MTTIWDNNKSKANELLGRAYEDWLDSYFSEANSCDICGEMIELDWSNNPNVAGEDMYTLKEEHLSGTHNIKDESFESKASEWTPSKGHDWQPPTQKDYKDLPKADKNQKIAGNYSEPDFKNLKQDGRNRNDDGKFSKEGWEEDEVEITGDLISPSYNVGSRVKVSGDNDNEGYDGFRDKVLIVTHVATSMQEHRGFDEGVGQALYDLKTLNGEDIGSSLYDYELESA